jgi:hypothetical protein
VVVPRDDWHLRREPAFRPVTTDPLLVQLTELDPAMTDRWLASRTAPQSRLPATSDALLESLGHAVSPLPALSA